jgi:8-oxo-dGTP pyrophosphatase MutT (NUDIX family)
MTDDEPSAAAELTLLPPDDARLASATDLAVARRHIEAAAVEGPAVEHQRDVLAFVDHHPDALLRSCTEGHLTGSALVVDAAGSRTLLMLHRKLGRWFQPGGHADGDAGLAAAALREATEETGIDGLRLAWPAIDVDIHRVEPPGEPAHLHLDTRYLVVAPAGAVEHGNEESLALRWVTLDELDALGVDDSTRRLAARGLALAPSLAAAMPDP